MRIVWLIAVALALAGRPALAADPPACFTSQLPDLASSDRGNPDRRCQILELVLENISLWDIAWIPGRLVDSALFHRDDVPPFPSGTFVLRFRVTAEFNHAFTSGKDQLVRIQDSEMHARYGAWWVPKEIVVDERGQFLSTAQIEDVLALPTPAPGPGAATAYSVVAYANSYDAGTYGYVGIVAPAFGRPGMGIQFYFPGEPVFSARDSLGPASGTPK